MAAHMQIYIADKVFLAPMARDVLSVEELKQAAVSLAESIDKLEYLSIGLIGGGFLALGKSQLRQAVFVFNPY